MTKHQEKRRDLHRAAQRAYTARQRAARSPSMQQLLAAIGRSLQNMATAHFVNIGPTPAKQLLHDLMAEAHRDLRARGFVDHKVKGKLADMLKPRKRFRDVPLPVDQADHEAVAEVLAQLRSRNG